MPFIDDFDDPALQDENRDPVLRRLDRLMADPVRQDFGDPALIDYIDRQRDRLTDTRGAPVGGDFEPFEPAVQRSDIRLESPVGAEEANHPLAVYNAKKLLSAAGFHAFAPGIEGMGEASPRFLADLRRFQAAHDLAPDAVTQPGGPTVHMLTRKVFGLADGPPPDSEREHFQERFATDPNRTLSGQPIFGGPDGEGVEVIPAKFKWRPKPRPRPHRGSDSGDGAKPPTGGSGTPPGPIPPTTPSEKDEEIHPEMHEDKFKAGRVPQKVAHPAYIYRYPDGRLYVAIRPNGDIGTSRERGFVHFQPLHDKQMIDTLRKSVKGTPWIDYPRLSDQSTFEQRRAAGKESYVRGEVLDKHGFPIAATILIDPDSGQPLRAPVGKDITLTMDQMQKLGLTRWHQPHRRSR